MWSARSPQAQVAQLEGAIQKVRADQRHLEAQLSDAVINELRGMAMVDAARAVQGRYKRLIEEHAQAISSLQDEIAELIPKQRQK